MADFKKQLLDVLAQIKGSGTFVSSGTRPFIFPAMELQGVGEISFPVSTDEAKKIIQQAHKAPFGKGGETVQDSTVRSAWEIDAAKLTFANKNWSKFIQKVVEKVKSDLGIEGRSVSANLYKLLIYEKGDFFLPHRDSEKEPGMFGTLIIGLPSKHEGGELLVRFNGTTHTIDFSQPANDYQLSFAAFYADCEHEIKPIHSGHRVCLVYNLVQKEGSEKIALQPLGDFAERLAGILKTDGKDKKFPKIVLLGHQYTPSNFTMEALKGDDRPKAEALLLAAEKVSFYAKLGLVTCYQMGELVENYDGRKNRSGSRRWVDDFYDEQSTENATMGEVFDEHMEVEHWMKEGVPPLRNLQFGEEDLISAAKLNEGEPIEKNPTEYTGNAGMEMEYWYHYAAVFLWPRKSHYDMLIDLPTDNKLDWIAYYNQQRDTLNTSDFVLVNKLIENGFQNNGGDELNFNPLAEWLINLDDDKYVFQETSKILESHFNKISFEYWEKLLFKYTPAQFANIFATVGKMGEAKMLKHLLGMLNYFQSGDEASLAFITKQVKQIPGYLQLLNLAEMGSKETVKDIFRQTIKLSSRVSEDEAWLEQTGEAFTRVLNRYFVNDVLAAVILKSDKKNMLCRNIMEVCLTDLRNRVKNKPQPPADWSRAVPSSTGHHSKIWQLLSSFLQSPTQQVFDYRKAQAERSDMEYAIKSVTIDLTMETIRSGLPHTLRITKTQQAYKKELAQWNEDVKILNKSEEWAGTI